MATRSGRRGWVALIAAGLLVVGSCSTDDDIADDGEGDTSGSQVSEPTGSSSTSAIVGLELAIADSSHLLAPEDVGNGAELVADMAAASIYPEDCYAPTD